MDARLAKILMERGRLKPRIEPLERPSALLQQMRIGRGRVKYEKPQDLLRLPRNPAEKAAQQELALLTEDKTAAVRAAKKSIREMTPQEQGAFIERLLDYISLFKMP